MEILKSKMDRRKLLLAASAGGIGLLAGKSAFAQAVQACRLTPRQVEGPFYPVQDQLDKDNDLTMVIGRSGRARGQIVYVGGYVVDQSCQPVAGALVEIWQACESGRYNHPNETNTSVPLDEDFQYWGKAVTDAQGRYIFKTIIPGAYPADATWMRPAHIHFKVSRKGYHELITQMYFEGDPHNARDRILNSLSPSDRAAVIVRFKDGGAYYGPGSKVGGFNITLRKV